MVRKVRCIGGWIFYDGSGRTCFLSKSKLNEQDPYAVDFLRRMKRNENRHFSKPVAVLVVHGRKPGALLVHRIDGVAQMIGWKDGREKSVQQKKLM